MSTRVVCSCSINFHPHDGGMSVFVLGSWWCYCMALLVQVIQPSGRSSSVLTRVKGNNPQIPEIHKDRTGKTQWIPKFAHTQEKSFPRWVHGMPLQLEQLKSPRGAIATTTWTVQYHTVGGVISAVFKFTLVKGTPPPTPLLRPMLQDMW